MNYIYYMIWYDNRPLSDEGNKVYTTSREAINAANKYASSILPFLKVVKVQLAAKPIMHRVEWEFV